MSDRRLRTAVALLAAAGSTVTAYLVYVRYSGAPLACTSGGCAAVQRSSYSTVVGVPVAALGLVAYLTLLASSLFAGEAARAVGSAVALAGVAFGGYLLYVQLNVIHAVCEWCVGSDAIMTSLAALMLVRMSSAVDRMSPPPDELRPAGNPHGRA